MGGSPSARCLADPELNHPFSHPGRHPRHVERLAAYWAEVFGGPARFSQECGDHSTDVPTGRPMPHWSWDGLEPTAT